jgi:YD repeat-containing protein
MRSSFKLPVYSRRESSAAPGGTVYDNDGNLTHDTFHVYQWDANGRPVAIDAVNATYDALGNLVEQDGPTWNEEYLYDENRRQLAGAVGQSQASSLKSRSLGRLVRGQPPGAQIHTPKRFDGRLQRTLEWLSLPVLAVPFWGRPPSLPRAPTRKAASIENHQVL